MVRLTGGSVARWTAAALAAAAFIGGNLGCGPTSNDADDGGGPTGPGPWPTDAYKNYSVDYGIDWVQSVGIDDGDNLWLLRDREIGVLRPGETKPLWVKNLGQAREPFGKNAPAMGSRPPRRSTSRGARPPRPALAIVPPTPRRNGPPPQALSSHGRALTMAR